MLNLPENTFSYITLSKKFGRSMALRDDPYYNKISIIRRVIME